MSQKGYRPIGDHACERSIAPCTERAPAGDALAPCTWARVLGSEQHGRTCPTVVTEILGSQLIARKI